MESFRAVRANTIKVARDIPEENYSFRPAEGTPTVLQLFHSIIQRTEFLVTVATICEPVTITHETRDAVFARICTTDTETLITKAQILKALVKSMENIEQRVNAHNEDFLNETFTTPWQKIQPRLWIIQCAKEQEMVYRAQLLQIERMLGIVPHTTRRQQRLKP